MDLPIDNTEQIRKDYRDDKILQLTAGSITNTRNSLDDNAIHQKGLLLVP